MPSVYLKYLLVYCANNTTFQTCRNYTWYKYEYIVYLSIDLRAVSRTRLLYYRGKKPTYKTYDRRELFRTNTYVFGSAVDRIRKRRKTFRTFVRVRKKTIYILAYTCTYGIIRLNTSVGVYIVSVVVNIHEAVHMVYGKRINCAVKRCIVWRG